MNPMPITTARIIPKATIIPAKRNSHQKTFKLLSVSFSSFCMLDTPYRGRFVPRG